MLALLAVVSAPGAASAAEGDLDLAFGTAGLAQLPAGDIDGQGAPLLDGRARVTIAAFRDQRAIAGRFTSRGLLDDAFGSGGTVATELTPAFRDAATTVDEQGRLIVAGGNGGGKLAIERRLPDGSLDPSFSGDGRMTVSLGGSVTVPTTLLAHDGKLLLTASNDGQGSSVFTVARLDDEGLDRTFSRDGIVQESFGRKQSGAYDVVPLPDGSGYLAVGAAGDAGYVPRADVAIAWLGLDGNHQRAPKVVDAILGTPERAAAVSVEPTGAFVVAGTWTTQGFVARFTPTGTLDTAFSGDGVLNAGLGLDGAGFVPVDVAHDRLGRVVVGGTSPGLLDTSVGRWTVLRLNPTGAAPLDTSFSGDGRAPVAICNGSGAAVSGVAARGSRIHVAGSCGASRRAAVARLVAAPAITGFDLDVTPGTEAAGHEVTKVDRFPAQALTLAAVDTQSGAFRSGAFRSGAFRSGAFRSGAFRSGAFRSGAFRSGAFRSGAFRSGAFRSGPIGDAIPLSNLPLEDPEGQRPELSWGWVLEGTSLAGDPMHTLTLGDVVRLRESGDAPDQFVARFDGLTLDLIDIARTPLRDLSLAAIFLDVALERLADPPGGWCAFLDQPLPGGREQPARCANGVDPARTTLAELEFLGDDLSAYYAQPIALTGEADVASAPPAFIARFGLNHVELSRSQLGSILAREARELIAGCDEQTCGDASTKTLADVQAARPADAFTAAATIGHLLDIVDRGGASAVPAAVLPDVMAAILIPDAYGIETLSPGALRAVLDRAEIRETDVHQAAASFDVDCGQRDRGLAVAYRLPDAFRYVPGSGRVSEDGGAPQPLGEPRVEGGELVFDGDALPACRGDDPFDTRQVSVTIGVEPGFVLGPAAGGIAARVLLGGAQEGADSAPPTTVDDSRDSDQGDPHPLEIGDAHLGWISAPGDRDFYRFDVEQLPPGTRVSFMLSHHEHDADLVVLGAKSGVPTLAFRSGAFRSGAFRSGAFRSGGLGDSSAEPGVDGANLEPNLLQDIPIPEMDGMTVRASSIRRGTANESATVVVGEGDRDTSMIVQVSGFNETFATRPHVLRARVTPPPPPKPCIPDRTGLNDGAGGAWPQIEGDERTVFLLDQQRLRNLYGDADEDRDGTPDVTQLLARLDALAARSDVEGVVVPVESHPRRAEDERLDVRGAMVAWDDEPCSVEAANAVVARVNAVLDDVRSQLPNLRNVVMLGADAALPQGRVQDTTQQANQQAEADFVALGGLDNEISRAFREGFVLTDAMFADWAPRASHGGQAFIPQVAQGRLVETPMQMVAQIDQYMAADGALRPDTVRLTAYDFFSDSGRAQLEALRGLVGNDPAKIRSHIDDSPNPPSPWTGDQGRALLNDGPAGIFALNAHYTENEAQPSSNFYGRDDSIIRSSEITPPVGSLLFTMGCHAGLSLFDGLPSAPGDEVSALADWPQRIAAAQSVYLASTGFGLGDTEFNIYTELLLTYFAQELGDDVTVGQALMLAKQRHASELLVEGPMLPFDAKANQQLTMYGLPMYRLGDAGVEAPIGAPAASASAAAQDAGVRTEPFAIAGIAHERQDTAQGSYWLAVRDGRTQAPLAAHYRPVQPKLTLDVTADDGLPVHGALITELESRDHGGIDPVNELPLPASGPNRQPEPRAHTSFFPVAPLGLADRITREGRRDILTAATGQFRMEDSASGRGIQRLYSRIAGQLLRSASTDYRPAVAERFDVDLVDGRASWDVRTPDTDVTRVYVLYRTDGDADWHGVDLEQVGPGHWAGGEELPSGTGVVESFGQLVRGGVGTVGVTWNKGPGYRIVPGEDDPKARVVQPEQPSESGWFNSPVTLELDKGAHADATFTYRVDDGEEQLYTGPFTIDEEGRHVVRFRGSDGSHATIVVKIDLTLPGITGSTNPATPASGWFGAAVSSVAVAFACDDALSGVASCTGDRTVTAEGITNVVGTARDLAGNARTATVPVRIDRTAPTTTIDDNQLLLIGTPLRGLADDRNGTLAVSGPRTVVVEWTQFGTTTNRTYSCTSGTATCRWEVAPPGSGVWSVQARSVDAAGNAGALSEAATVTVQGPQ